MKPIPYNISEWKKVGEERGYFDYFKGSIIKDVEYWINDWWGEGQHYGIKGLIKRIRKI